MTSEEAEKYINCAKAIVGDDGNIVQSYDAHLTSMGMYQLNLCSVDNTDDKFVLIIRPNAKIGIKMTLHLMNAQKVGLIRLDYNGSHKNPLEWKVDVPDIYKPYAGYQFQEQTHLHRYVENYSLKWALPIEDTGIEPRAIDATDSAMGWQEAVDGFCHYLNIQGTVTLR